MNLYLSLNAWDDDAEHLLTTGKLYLSDDIAARPALVLHRALRSEVKALLRDMEPYLVMAAYRALDKAERAARTEDGAE